jgi:hypothetical protein
LLLDVQLVEDTAEIEVIDLVQRVGKILDRNLPRLELFAARQLSRSRWRRSRSSNGMTLEQGLELSNVWLEFRTEAASAKSNPRGIGARGLSARDERLRRLAGRRSLGVGVVKSLELGRRTGGPNSHAKIPVFSKQKPTSVV